MGNVLSSDTIYAVAYLTDLGRKLLFDPIGNNRFVQNGSNVIDSFKPVYFSMSDPDYNYTVTSGISLETGDISNVSGKNNGSIKGTTVTEEFGLISVNGEVNGITGLESTQIPSVSSSYVLSTSETDNTSSINLSTINIISE